MTPDNNVKAVGLRGSRFDWESFDALPRAKKEICWESPLKIHVSEKASGLRDFHPQALANLRKAERKSCLAVYGPLHPQGYATAAEWRKACAKAASAEVLSAILDDLDLDL